MWYFHLTCVIFTTFSLFSVDGNDTNIIKKNEKVSIQKLVYGGSSHKITDAPYMAILFTSGGHFACGACIVHERFLLTAAHCYNSDFTFFIKVGTDNMEVGGVIHDIEKIIVHPRYIDTEFDYDVAVIKLKTKLKFNRRVNPIKMSPKNIAIKSGAIMESMGFGETEISKASRHLLIVKVPYVPHNECRSKLSMIDITERMLCAGGFKGKDTCQGDSGGPLVYNNMLVGLVSFGIDCGEELPAVYANVPVLRDFIDHTIRVHSFQNIYNHKVFRPWWFIN